MYPFVSISLASLLIMAVPVHAAGSAKDGLQAMKELNVIVLGDMKAGHDVEGKAFVGGDLTGNGTYGIGNDRQGLAPSERPTLTVVGNARVGNLGNGANGGAGKVSTSPGVMVGGNLSGMNLNAANTMVRVGGAISNANGSPGSAISAGGARSGYLNANGAIVSTGMGDGFTAPLVASLRAEKAEMAASLLALSAAMGAMDTTAGSGFDFRDSNNVKLNAVAGSNGIAVINVDAATLFGSTRGLSYNFDPALTTIV